MGTTIAEGAAHNLGSRTAPFRTPIQNVPPHRRAHLLLQNIAGLTTRLLELAGSKDWQGAPSKINVPPLLAGAVISPEGIAASSCKDILGILEAQQALLFEALQELMEMREIENEKLRIKEAIEAKDNAMREFARRLRDAQQLLENTLEEYENYKRPKRDGVSRGANDILDVGLGSINVQELVAYAHRISYTTFAPPEFATGMPLRGAFPPAPQEEQMRASKLYQINELDLGLPKPPVSKSLPVAGGDADVGKAEGSGTPKTPQGALPPTVPAGWKPGMPVDLPLELPPMPPGWKPGDPIPLMDIPPVPQNWKPGDAVVLTPAPWPVEPLVPGGPVKAPPMPVPVSLPPLAPAGVIHVPFVQLDLNPELEDDFGSEYSDDDASSEDDDD